MVGLCIPAAVAPAIPGKRKSQAAESICPSRPIEASINHDSHLIPVRPEPVEALRQAQPERCGFINWGKINSPRLNHWTAWPPEATRCSLRFSRSAHQQIDCRNHEHREQRRSDHAADHGRGDALHDLGARPCAPHDGKHPINLKPLYKETLTIGVRLF